MTLDQMLIEIGLGIQEMGSKTQDRLEPEEIALVINKMQSRFIVQKLFPESDPVGKYFYVDQSRVAAIRTLLVRNKELPLTFSKEGVGGVYSSPLPNDYRYSVSIRSDVQYDCKVIEAESKSVGGRVNILQIPKQTSYKNPSIFINGQKVVEYEKSVLYYEELYQFIGYVLSNTDNVYWETYGRFSSTNSFLIPTVGLGVVNVALKSDNKTIASATNDFNNQTVLEGESLDERVSRHELYAPDKWEDSSDDPYAKTSPETPISTIYGDEIKTKTDDSFLLINTKLDYIRNPRPVDISLGIGCELPSDTHDEIVDMSVKYILHAIENSQKYQLTTAEYLNR